MSPRYRAACDLARIDFVKPLQLSSAEFAALGARITALAADYLAGLGELRTFPQNARPGSPDFLRETLPEEGLGPAALDALQAVLENSRPPSPRFFGYVLGSGEPVAALADLLASVLNQIGRAHV